MTTEGKEALAKLDCEVCGGTARASGEWLSFSFEEKEYASSFFSSEVLFVDCDFSCSFSSRSLFKSVSWIVVGSEFLERTLSGLVEGLVRRLS